MRMFISCLLIALLSFGLLINEASAKRFGGGRSFGVQRSNSSLFSSPRPQNSAALGQRSSTSRWGGILGGLLIGGLLASLFMGNGVLHGLMTWLILGLVLFLVVNFFRKRMNPGMQSVASNNAFGQNAFNNFRNVSNSSNASNSDYPVDFNAEDFLRKAKVTFLRLQAAYDQKNMQDLNAFTAPEVFGEIKMLLDERGDEPNKTEVINLNAELLDVSKQFDSSIASVRFTGSIKENADPVMHLDEIWHFRQFGTSKDWIVGGIQQESGQS